MKLWSFVHYTHAYYTSTRTPCALVCDCCLTTAIKEATAATATDVVVVAVGCNLRSPSVNVLAFSPPPPPPPPLILATAAVPAAR